MGMKKIMESFNTFLEESTELPDFRFQAALVNRSEKDRGKEDVLNDIRSLSGVTIVAVREAEKPKPGEDYSLLSIKVDRYTLGHYSVRTIINSLTKKINRIDGVLSFSAKGIPELM
ncbi:hypothetical protein CL629_02045 [bacterium]|nr:hypothetical protein [bacterium]|tara:strand:+ start:3002 stop:3349 length:348 start_codon:yes stop_codon:yes gene_type:complete